MEKTGILLITICSNNKRQGGSPFVKGEPSILTTLPEHASDTINKRRAIMRFLKEGDAVRDGVEVSRMQLNSRLKLGPDFGGHESTLFMPAHQRYIGRFFAEVGSNNPNILVETVHHVLILSGLYGILLPEEQIQAYSCHVYDHPQVSETWKDSSFLTSLVLAYINKNAIKRVLDLTGQDAYRRLLDWDRVARKVNTIHFFSDQYAGPAALPSLGELARTRLLSKTEKDILDIEPGAPIYLDDHGMIAVTELPTAPDGMPKESFAPAQQNPEQAEGPKEKKSARSADEPAAPLGHARDIPITSGEHNTIFGKRISAINDLPIEVQDIIRQISRCPDVLEIFLGQFFGQGAHRRAFEITIASPQPDSGHIFGRLEGPGAIGRKQKVDIRVTKGREAVSYAIISNLLTGNAEARPANDPRNEPISPVKKSAATSAEDLERALQRLLAAAQEEGKPFLDVVAGDLHRTVGGYPGPDHRMPICCDVMRKTMKPSDEALSSPPKGKGASLRIRYNLPR